MINNFIHVRVGNKILDLLPGSEISVTEENPALQFNAILEAYSDFPFNLADSALNKLELGLPEIPENIDSLPINVPAQLYFGGSLYKEGLLSILRYTGQSYEAKFVSFNELLYDIRNKLLGEFAYGGLRDLGVTVSDRLANMKLASVDGNTDPVAPWDFTFVQVHARNFLQYTDTNLPATVKPFQSSFTDNLGENEIYINQWDQNTSTYQETTFYYPIVPFFFLEYVLKQILVESNINVSISDAALLLFKPAIIFNNYTIETPAAGTTISNAHNTSVEPARYINPVNHLPKITVAEFLNAIRKLGLFFDTSDHQLRIYTTNEMRERKDSMDITGIAEAGAPVDFLPAKGITLSQQLDNNEALFEGAPGAFLESGHIIARQQGINLGTFDTVADLPTATALMVNTWALVLEDNMWYLVNTDLPAWAAMFENFEPKVIGDGSENLQDIPGSLYMYFGPRDPYEAANGNTRFKYTPTIDMPATQPQLQIFKEFGFRLFFWRGMQPGDTGDDYPFGTSGFLDYNGDPVGEQLQLQVEGRYGIYEVLLKDMLFLNRFENKMITQRIRASAADIIKLKPFTRIIRSGLEYFLVSKQFTANSTGVKECILKLVPRKT